jgi:hypothetical protein
MCISGRTSLLYAFACLGIVCAAESGSESLRKKSNTQPNGKSAQIDLSAASQKKPRINYANIPSSFEPNQGQSNSHARFTAKSTTGSAGGAALSSS